MTTHEFDDKGARAVPTSHDADLRITEWLDWICHQEIHRRGVLPDLAERARLRERLRPTAKRVASGDRKAFHDLVRLYGKLRQGPAERTRNTPR